MKSKKGIALSINFLVVIVISLVVFGSGMAFLAKLMGGAEKIKDSLDSKTEAQLEKLLLDEGKKVALPKHAIYTQPGIVVSFGIGILNIDKQFGTKFKVEVKLSTAVDAQDKQLAVLPTVSGWLLYSPGPYTIKENDYKTIFIGISVPKTATKGTYIFDAKVLDENGKVYDNIKKFSVIVK